ncbi:hypothetical protein [Rubritalea profundi]|uniref:Dipeptidylpeptidase IV N-terminal domain-containing protein n=1 Tax=Rubritalea profundi TaxID=1658618 RepID=A0A2S7U265_9BACT|nr:hypothetical protein [Rubritalea profundi]PQJ28452.1 hypothetical protein BSZ32_07965 [Rubritalea profundi]
MKFIALALFFFISLGHADEVRDSPDGKYEVIYTSKILYEDNLTIRMKSGGKVICRTIASTYEPNRFIELIWSPDSTLLAVISGGTKTTSEVRIIRFHNDTAEELKLPDYHQNIYGRHKRLKGGRDSFAKHLRWENNVLSFDSEGSWTEWVSNPSDLPEDWYAYSIKLTIVDARVSLAEVNLKNRVNKRR